MLQIDGAKGEGGGQILRTALTLSMVTGTAISIDNIRAGRAKPGLMRQHLACVKAAQAISQAEVMGAEVGATALSFKPRAIQAGDYAFSVGSAGSTLLIFQTLLPALAMTQEPSLLRFYGGTHNMMAPSFDFIATAFVPLLQRAGVGIEMQLARHGFYPQGGGEWQVVIRPSGQIQAIELLDRGALLSHEAVVTSGHLPDHIARRELEEIKKCCNWPAETMRNETVSCLGSGNIVSLRLTYPHCSAVFESIARIGVPAERVARQAIKQLRRYQASQAVVDEHLADQLLLPMAIGEGGAFKTLRPSRHCCTNRDLIHRFIDSRFQFVELERDLWEIRL